MNYFFFNKVFIFCYIIYAILSYFVVKHVMKQTEKYRIIKPEDKPIHEKYPEFRRLDAKCWDEKSLLIGAILFSWIKLAGVLSSIIICYVSLKVMLWGKNIEDYHNIEIKNKAEKIARISAKLVRLSFGIIVEDVKVDYDYSKYLGKGYTQDKSAANISNHSSWLEILLFIEKLGAGFITSVHVKSFPMIGYIATTLGCIFVDRNDKKDREAVLNKVSKKLTDIYSGEDLSKILIFPEGTTSNTTSILPFKKGAFYCKLPLKPYVITFEVINKISLAMEVIEILYHAFIIICTPVHHIKIYSLPVFSPNEYFFSQNNTGKEDWIYYADTLRDIMCDVSGLKKSLSGSWEDKKQYLDFLRGTPKQE
jgi:1-acyl-sn-glycerol-3-phosphate acyltransferase